MFHIDTPQNWQEVLDRDGMLIVGSSVKQFFVIEKATDEDRVVALVSALDFAGKLEWKEETFKKPGSSLSSLDSYRYRAPLSGASAWSVLLNPPFEARGVHSLFLSGGKDFSHLIYNPQGLIRRIYYRIRERFGYSVPYFPSSLMSDYFEEKRKVVTGGLAVLEAVAKGRAST